MLDIPSEEIEISSIHGGDEDKTSACGEIMLADYLPNGAGFVEWISRNWQTLVKAILESDPHAGDQPCDTSCYRT
jgi:hypothetical protein